MKIHILLKGEDSKNSDFNLQNKKSYAVVCTTVLGERRVFLLLYDEDRVVSEIWWISF